MCRLTAVLPGSRMPDAIHSKTRLRASPGLIGPEALLIAFSTSSSMALDRENLVTIHILVFPIQYFRWLLKNLLDTLKPSMNKASFYLFTHPAWKSRPGGYSLTKVTQDTNNNHAGLESIGSSLQCNKVKLRESMHLQQGADDMVGLSKRCNTTVHNGSFYLVYTLLSQCL